MKRKPQNAAKKAATKIEEKGSTSRRQDLTQPRRSASKRARRAAKERLKLEVIFPKRIPAARIRARAKKAMKRRNQGDRRSMRLSPEDREQGMRLVIGDYIEALRERIKQENPDNPPPKRSSMRLAPLLSHFDWRLGGVTPAVRNQNKRKPGREACGACWAFAATAAMESNFMIKVNRFLSAAIPKEEANFTFPLAQFGISVQHVLNCVSRGDCVGGWPGDAFERFVTRGVPTLRLNVRGDQIDDKDFIGEKRPCERKKNTVKAVAWDYVNDVPDKTPSVKKMKEALLDHGPLVVSVHLDEEFKKYPEKGEVFNERNPHDTNHVVLLTGWDEKKKAWIIQNSFGTEWGISCLKPGMLKDSVVSESFFDDLIEQKGCMYINWDSNHIGKYAMWIEAPFDLGEFVDSEQ